MMSISQTGLMVVDYAVAGLLAAQFDLRLVFSLTPWTFVVVVGLLVGGLSNALGIRFTRSRCSSPS